MNTTPPTSSRYLAISAASLAFALLDSFGSSWKTNTHAGAIARGFSTLFFYVAPWYLFIGLSVSTTLGLFVHFRDHAVRLGLPTPTEPFVVRDAWLAALPFLGAFAFLDYTAILVSITAFNNHELGSLLIMLCTLLMIVVFVALWLGMFAMVRGARQRIKNSWVRNALLLPLVMAVPIFAFVRIGLANLDGLKILGAWMAAGPIAALIVGAGVYLLSLGRDEARLERAEQLFFRSTGVFVVLAIAMSFVNKHIATDGMQGGLWAKQLVWTLRQATDFDRDRYSSFFDGGDCAPFNNQINPGMRDIPGDGIDQNCIGGDAVNVSEQPGPRWYDEPPGKGQTENLVVITIEAMRAKALSVYGYKHPNTPNINRLAERSVLFNKFYSASSATPLSLASIWTSTTPSHIIATAGPQHFFIDRNNPWFPEMLQQANFVTGAFLVNYLAFDPARWNMGFHRGFTTYDVSTQIDQRGGNFYGFPSGEVIRKSCRWIESMNNRRFFLWTHLVEPHEKHEPYPTGPTFGLTPEEIYASDVWAADLEVGHLVECLERRGLMNKTIVVITGDHGESIGEHGFTGHYSSVFEPEVRTLGLMYVPTLGRRAIDVAAVHEDLAPTMLNLLGVRGEFDKLRGRNLVPVLLGHSPEPATFFVELEGFNSRARAIGLVDYPFKLIHIRGTSHFAMYNVEKDPDEQANVSREHPEVFERLYKQTIVHLESAAAN